ncbi:MAG TPA: TetR/AcrR family transcriptional regulator [Casimicrobiaceae bacterium]
MIDPCDPNVIASPETRLRGALLHVTIRFVNIAPGMRTYGGLTADERVAARRAKLLDAGLELFGTHGYAGTGVKDICREAGLTDRYFYESFTDGGALFLAVFDRLTDELFEAVAVAVLDSGNDPQAQLRSAVGTFIDALAADPRKPRVLFAEAAAAGPDAAAHMRMTLRRFTALVAATARQHLPASTPDEDIQLLALSLVGLLERVVTEHVDGELRIPLGEVVDRCVALYASMLRLLASGRP